MRIPGIAAFALFAVSASGQDVSRIYHFVNIKLAAYNDCANIFRSIGDIKNVTVDPFAATLTVQGSAAQTALSDWLFPEVDQAASGPAPTNHTYTMTGTAGTVRVFHFAHAGTRAQIQEIVNVVRTTADIPRVFQLWDSSVMVVRGTSDQVGVADWLVSQLDLAGPIPGAPEQARQFPGVADSEIRVAHLAHTSAPAGIQGLTNAVRTIADINRVFPVNSVAVLVYRGSSDQVGLADWLLSQLDQAAGQQGPAPHQQLYRDPWTKSNDEVHVFYPAHAAGPQAVQKIVNAVRTQVHVQRIFPCYQPNALAVRGSADQVTQAGALIAQMNH